MSTPILVCDVTEQHTCAGRKSILITAQKEYDENITTQFLLTRLPMHPTEKLRLATVDIHDTVLTESTFPSLHNPLVEGDYFRIENLTQERTAQCRCGSLLVSDGIDIFCKNPDCPLTVSARLRNLAERPFFQEEFLSTYLSPYELSEFQGIVSRDRPFSLITNSRFWGAPGIDVSYLLQGNGGLKHGYVSLATFLVEPLMQHFLDTIPYERLGEVQYFYEPIQMFYGFMSEMIHHRDYSSPVQNHLLYQFLLGLGIEALRPDVATKMIRFEINTGGGVGVMYPYAWLLTHPNDMSRELGVHPLEAVAITSEVLARHREFSDIFTHYGTQPEIFDLFIRTS